jgi:hypothetical protein
MSNKFSDWCREADLPAHCAAHGVRKAGATIAAENGANEATLNGDFRMGRRQASSALHAGRAPQKDGGCRHAFACSAERSALEIVTRCFKVKKIGKKVNKNKRLAGEARLELATPGFGDRCSSQLSYTPNAALYCRNICADASA